MSSPRLDPDVTEDTRVRQRMPLDDIARVLVAVVVDDDHLEARSTERLLLERVEQPAKPKATGMRRNDNAHLRTRHGGHDTGAATPNPAGGKPSTSLRKGSDPYALERDCGEKGSDPWAQERDFGGKGSDPWALERDFVGKGSDPWALERDFGEKGS